MSYYIRLKDKAWPRYEGDIRLDTGVFDGAFSCPDTYAYVEETPQPTYDPDTHYVVYAEPEEIDGTYYTRWVVQPFTAEELLVRQRLKEGQSLLEAITGKPEPEPVTRQDSAEFDPSAYKSITF